MNSQDRDTIVAIATAPGQGGIGVIRLSGPRALEIGSLITQVTSPQHRYAHYCAFHQPNTDNTLDTGLLLYFKGPRSFTGEDVIELHGHGGPVVLNMLIKACCDCGARMARPGEFSERAYLNDKIDLTQAEAIADLISSSTEAAAINASRSLNGAFSNAINTLVESVIQLRIFVEAAIDFPEEEIDFISEGRVREQLQQIINNLTVVHGNARQGTLIKEGMKLVIAGKPNAGKSSLLNALSGQDRAIVTAIEGTTRDTLTEHIQIDGLPLHIIDTAGLRHSDDPVEKEGIRRAWAEIESCDHVLLVVDDTVTTEQGADESINGAVIDELTRRLDGRIPITLVRNKCDLSGRPAASSDQASGTEISLSATTGSGLELLRDHLKQCAGYSGEGSSLFSARRRHLDALDRARGSLAAGELQLTQSGSAELLAEDLRQCQHHLDEITGEFSSDDLLGAIFSSFCIGK